MDAKLDKLDSKLDEIVRIQAEMQSDLKNHIYRTEIAEENIEKLANQIAPIQEHVALVKGMGKFLTFLATLIMAAAAILALK